MIETIIIMSLFCVGVRISFEEKMIFHPVYNFIKGLTYRKVLTINHDDKKVYEREHTWIAKPLIDCPYCFASTYGSLVFWTMFYLNHKPFTPDVLIECAICVVCSSPVAGGGCTK